MEAAAQDRGRLPGMQAVRVAAAWAALLAGCGEGQNLSDLQAFMEAAQAQEAGEVEPLPPFQGAPPFAYSSGDRRSPFEPPATVRKLERRRGESSVTPNLQRPQQHLEQYPIASLAMVGTLSWGGERHALVRDGEGHVHRVRAGDYLGTDHGRIRRIEAQALELIEIVPAGPVWAQRARTLAMHSATNPKAPR